MSQGKCYELAFWWLINWHSEGMQLVHGIAVQDVPPHLPFGHAWVELGKRVIDVATGQPKRAWTSTYYRAGRIDPLTVRRYSVDEARALALKFRHHGPWDPVIAAAAHRRTG